MSVGPPIQFRRMLERDRRQVRALLGDLLLRSVECAYLVAVMPGSPMIVGAAAISSVPIQSRPRSAPFALAVARPFRRRGIGRRLLKASSALARDQLEIPALCSWFGVERGSTDADLWTSLEFEARAPLAHYNADLRPYVDLMTLTTSRLRTRNRIPPDATVVPLSEAPIGPVIDLHLRYIGGKRSHLEHRLRGHGNHPYHRLLSQIAIQRGNVCGLALARINHEEKLVIDARVVAPHVRRSWVNPLMLQAMGLLSERLGLSIVRFTGNTKHADTHRIANRFGSSFVRIMDQMIRVGSPSDGDALEAGALTRKPKSTNQHGGNPDATFKAPAAAAAFTSQ